VQPSREAADDYDALLETVDVLSSESAVDATRSGIQELAAGIVDCRRASTRADRGRQAACVTGP
jgi:hypothetical protein